MDEADPRARVGLPSGAFLDRFGKQRNVTLPALSADGAGSIPRGESLDCEEFEDLVQSIANTADHRDDRLA
jgi:hypothetical protein